MELLESVGYEGTVADPLAGRSDSASRIVTPSMDNGLFLLMFVLVGYALGAVPFGVLVSKAMGLPDPRTIGSKNVGFTNVLRVSGKKAGTLTLAGDMGKGWIMGVLANQWLQDEWMVLLAAAAPVLGHLYSPFLGFSGGKGVATALGSILGVTPWVGVILLAIWLGAVAIWRYSSGGALAAFVSFPLVAAVFHPTLPFTIFAVALSALIILKHTANIERLWRGTESKIGQSRSPV